MLDLEQGKLTREEWTSIEVPLPEDEKHIIKLICNGYHDVNICQNKTLSLLTFLRIPISTGAHVHIYKRYIEPKIILLKKQYNLSFEKQTKHKKQSKKQSKKQDVLKKKDILRLENADKNMKSSKVELFEMVLLDSLEKMHYEKKSIKKYKSGWLQHFYTIKTLLTYSIKNVNTIFLNIIQNHIKIISKEVTLVQLLGVSQLAIEKNDKLLKYADEKLFDHQRKLFTYCNHENPKLISYVAPTGTGKTLSPLGLAEKHKIIFVCAARHVGLALAKAAISCNKKVAFAFGCEDATDIRLHYFAAKEYIRHKKSGGIAKVDNSVGDDVEIMITDLKSYLVAMHYMLAFNDANNLIMYWDEPTITLDYETHVLHEMIHTNWRENIIPNIILSSATLPSINELQETMCDFKSRFAKGETYSIVSHDARKTIPLLDKEGEIIMPHFLSFTYDDVKIMANHCLTHNTLMRYLDLKSCIDFILLVLKNPVWIASSKYHIEYHLPDLDSITMTNIKLYYLRLLANLKPELWGTILEALKNIRSNKINVGVRLSTVDAHTLVDGPTIYLANDVEKVAKFQLQDAKIPSGVVWNIMKAIKYNGVLSDKLSVLQKLLDDGMQKEEGKDKKMSSCKIPPELKKIKKNIEELQFCVKTVSLSSLFVPNTIDHLQRYAPDDSIGENGVKKAFSSNISENIVEKIMLIDDVEDTWKLLLLMGIGVFASHKSANYTEIMKTLAQEQKLYLIIASSDYIYGTNYQFCHGYLGKDMADMSQEKCIQAMGRVGRKSFQKDYSLRLRDPLFAKKLFFPEKNKLEAKHMATLFSTPIE